MKKLVRLLLIVSALCFVLVLLAKLVLRGSFDIDHCLDRGGCWDYQDRVCRKDEPDAQCLCDRSKKSGEATP